MSIADQLAATPPQIRCFALVGQFLSPWAALEAAINNAIQTALQIASVQAVVITHNMQLRDKINVLRTVCDQCVNEPDCTYYKNQLAKIARFSSHRNMVAHDAFHVDDAKNADGVMFVSAKMKGTFALPIV